MMKKLMFIIVLAVVGLMVTPVYAMSENDLSTKVHATYDINGNQLKVPTKYLNLFDQYLNEFELSGKDCQYIADQIDILVAAAKKKNVTSIDDFLKKCNDEIIKACENVSANTGVKATVLSDGRVSVSKYNKPNEVFAVIGTHLVVNTGYINILVIAGAIILMGAGILVFKLRKA